jgi:hypothetical protein
MKMRLACLRFLLRAIYISIFHLASGLAVFFSLIFSLFVGLDFDEENCYLYDHHRRYIRCFRALLSS